jgi:hypothetical protein
MLETAIAAQINEATTPRQAAIPAAGFCLSLDRAKAG